MNPLVGRERFMSVLVNHLDATMQGSGGCFVLDGPIGIGRTRLLKAVATEGVERGLTVACGRASGIDHPTPIRLLITFLRHVTTGDREFDDMVRPDMNPFRLIDRLGGLIKNAACRRPLLIVLDDAQHSDEVSALVLQGLVQSLNTSPVMWLLARGPLPAQSLAQHAIGWLIDRSAVHLRLGPLDDEAVVQLCTSFLGAKPDASVLRWAVRCEGNPWLLENMLGALVEAGQVLIVDGTASAVGDQLPEGAIAAVDRLLDELPPTVRRLLVHGRRIGPTFTVEDVAASIGEPAAELSSVADEAVRAGLMRRSAAELSFVHGMVQDALLYPGIQRAEPVPAPTEVEVPRPARAPGTDAHAEGFARQPVRAGPPLPRPRACVCADVVARAVASLGERFDDAPQTLGRALCLLAGAGRGEQAGRIVEAAVRSGIEPGAEVRLVLGLAQGLEHAGRHDIAAWHLQRALARKDLDDADRSVMAGLLADVTNLQRNVPNSADHQVNGIARPYAFDGAADVDDDMGASGAEPADRRPMPECRCQDTGESPLWSWVIRALVAADRFEEAAVVCATVKLESDKRADDWPEALLHGRRAELLLMVGRLDEARICAESALRLNNRQWPGHAVVARAVLTRVSLHVGDMDTASEHLRTAERLAADNVLADRVGLDWALAKFHAASGRPESAVRVLVNIDGQIAPDTLMFTEMPTAAATAVRLARQAGLSAEAEGAAELARQISERNPTVASLVGGAEHAEGLARRDVRALHHAIEHYRLGARPLITGVALENAAREEQNVRNKTRAVRLLESALDIYMECDARRDITRVQKKLRRLGIHNARTVGGDRPKSGWESLTSAELRVVRAIVDGNTNREAANKLFLSPHTVDSHLRRVFAKLALNSRVELTKQFIVHEAAPPVQAGPDQPLELKSGRRLMHKTAG